MSNLVVIIILFAGVVLLFTAGSLFSHFGNLAEKYDEMMNNRGNIDSESS
jgi:hypothetical protein